MAAIAPCPPPLPSLPRCRGLARRGRLSAAQPPPLLRLHPRSGGGLLPGPLGGPKGRGHGSAVRQHGHACSVLGGTEAAALGAREDDGPLARRGGRQGCLKLDHVRPQGAICAGQLASCREVAPANPPQGRCQHRRCPREGEREPGQPDGSAHRPGQRMGLAHAFQSRAERECAQRERELARIIAEREELVELRRAACKPDLQRPPAAVPSPQRGRVRCRWALGGLRKGLLQHALNGSEERGCGGMSALIPVLEGRDDADPCTAAKSSLLRVAERRGEARPAGLLHLLAGGVRLLGSLAPSHP